MALGTEDFLKLDAATVPAILVGAAWAALPRRAHIHRAVTGLALHQSRGNGVAAEKGGEEEPARHLPTMRRGAWEGRDLGDRGSYSCSQTSTAFNVNVPDAIVGLANIRSYLSTPAGMLNATDSQCAPVPVLHALAIVAIVVPAEFFR